jgi:hypothetical protein
MLTPLRRFYGLRWQGQTPKPADIGITLQNILIIATVLLAYGIVGSIDYATEKSIEAERQAEAFSVQQAAMLACLNGGSPGYYSIDSEGHRHYIVCDIYEVSDENTPPRKRQS